MMNEFLRAACYFLICLLIVSACWVGLEYILEGAVHTSEVDGYVAIVLSGIIADKYLER